MAANLSRSLGLVEIAAAAGLTKYPVATAVARADFFKNRRRVGREAWVRSEAEFLLTFNFPFEGCA